MKIRQLMLTLLIVHSTLLSASVAGTRVRLADLEIHTKTLTEHEISDLGHYIMHTFVGRIPDSAMMYVSEDVHYDVRMDVYVTKIDRNRYFSFVQVFNMQSLKRKLLAANISEEQIDSLLKSNVRVNDQSYSVVNSLEGIKQRLSDILDDIAINIMPSIEAVYEIRKSEATPTPSP